MLCKCRVDFINGRLVELKSTRDPEIVSFAKDAARFLYHGQIAYYRDGTIESGYPLEQPPAMITVGTEPPHDVVVYEILDEVLAAGRRLYTRLLRELAKYHGGDHWPGLAPDSEKIFCLPSWATEQDHGPITLDGETMIDG
jgi:hypothetical protein